MSEWKYAPCMIWHDWRRVDHRLKVCDRCGAEQWAFHRMPDGSQEKTLRQIIDSKGTTNA